MTTELSSQATSIAAAVRFANTADSASEASQTHVLAVAIEARDSGDRVSAMKDEFDSAFLSCQYKEAEFEYVSSLGDIIAFLPFVPSSKREGGFRIDTNASLVMTYEELQERDSLMYVQIMEWLEGGITCSAAQDLDDDKHVTLEGNDYRWLIPIPPNAKKKGSGGRTSTVLPAAYRQAKRRVLKYVEAEGINALSQELSGPMMDHAIEDANKKAKAPALSPVTESTPASDKTPDEKAEILLNSLVSVIRQGLDNPAAVKAALLRIAEEL